MEVEEERRRALWSGHAFGFDRRSRRKAARCGARIDGNGSHVLSLMPIDDK